MFLLTVEKGSNFSTSFPTLVLCILDDSFKICFGFRDPTDRNFPWDMHLKMEKKHLLNAFQSKAIIKHIFINISM